MGLGLLNVRMDPSASVDRNYKIVQELLHQFEAKFGSTNCNSLTGVHLGTAEGLDEFRKKGQIEYCLDYVEFTTSYVVLLNNKNGFGSTNINVHQN